MIYHYSQKWKWPLPCHDRSVHVRKVIAMHCIHLAVKWGRIVKRDHVQDYDHKGGKARKRVNLSK